MNGIGQSCAFCGTREVAWLHPLAADLVAYRQDGKGHTLPGFWTLCDRCEGIYASGDDEAAADVMRASAWAWVPDHDVAECVRKPLAVFRRADLGPLWPAEHALWLEELRPAFGEDDDDETADCWLVRSPWPSLSTRQTLSALWRWMEQDAPANPPHRGADRQSLIREFFTWTEHEATAFAELDTND